MHQASLSLGGADGTVSSAQAQASQTQRSAGMGGAPSSRWWAQTGSPRPVILDADWHEVTLGAGPACWLGPELILPGEEGLPAPPAGRFLGGCLWGSAWEPEPRGVCHRFYAQLRVRGAGVVQVPSPLSRGGCPLPKDLVCSNYTVLLRPWAPDFPPSGHPQERTLLVYCPSNMGQHRKAGQS